MSKKIVFKNFLEYWHYVRYLSEEQKNIVYNSLPIEQQNLLVKSYVDDDWDDLFARNNINKIIDNLKKHFGYDLVDIRYKILCGKSVYLPRRFWQIVNKEMDKFRFHDINYILGGIKAEVCKKNEEVVLLVPGNEGEEEKEDNEQ